MARPRNRDNQHLPAYVMMRAGRFYLEPKGALREKLGKSCISLGSSYLDMYAKYAEVVGDDGERDLNTMADLIDKYMREVSPKKALETHKSEIKKVKYLRLAFGRMRPTDVTKIDIYKYIDVRSVSAPVGVNREIALLSAIMKKGLRWGALKESPCKDIEYNKEEPRDRYVSHDELKAFKNFAISKNPLIVAYLEFKYITGLRTADILRLRKRNLLEKGIYVYISKTKQKRLMRWSDALRAATKALIDSNWRPKGAGYSVESDYLVHTRKGQSYTDDGWRANFQRLMSDAIKEKILEERFCEHDIRAKTGSDSASTEKARVLLVHKTSVVTERHYRRQIEEIDPLL